MKPGNLPLVLISQIQRSGGSMMAQLLDGHPELYAHPHEIMIGSPNKWDWPQFTLAESPEDWFEFLYEPRLDRLVAKGFTKGASNRYARKLVHPFNFSLKTLRGKFLEYCEALRPIGSQRQVLDAYFRAFFDAWEDHAATGRERFVAGFTPRVVMYPACVERFLADYPDGRLISIVRDPCSWYASTSRHNRDHRDVEIAIEEWSVCMQSIARVAGRENVLVVIYEDILREPETSMRRIADFIGITYDSILLTPTFLGQPMLPNSSFDVATYGINREMLDRHETLEPAIRQTIAETTLPLYRELVERHGLGHAA
jgi:hypothetical protein